jgi:hypothetical protein
MQEPYLTNSWRKFTSYEPVGTQFPVPKHFVVYFGRKPKCLPEDYIEEYRLEQVSPTSTFTKEDYKLLHNVWQDYKTKVQVIFDTVFKLGEPLKVEDKQVKPLCVLVRIISQILCKIYPLRTLGFYGLPLFMTASENGNKTSKQWVAESTNYGDHWVC